MFSYRAVFQYDGSGFFGWQSQPSGNTIQDTITNAINKITGENITLIGSGRTDSGVHALGQVASFSLLNQIDIYKFTHSLNSVLPASVSMTNIQKSDPKFHPRFDARSRVYFYLISIRKSPFLDRYSFYSPILKDYEITKLNYMSKELLGPHDFSSFCKVKTDTADKICNVHSISWRKSGTLIYFRIEANRFLHGMVRTIVGTILRAYSEEDNPFYLTQVLNSKDRNKAGEAVPAKGLFLFRVNY